MYRGKSSPLLAALALTLTLLAPDAPRAEEGAQAMNGAQAFVQDLGDRTTAFLAAEPREGRARHDGLKALVREGFDLELMGRFVLGAFWRTASEDQREEFQDLFAERLLSAYARRLETYRTETLALVGSRPVGKRDVLVETHVESADGPLVMGWRVRQRTDRHRIVDVTVNGISLAMTERQEFSSAAKSLGVEGLLAVLRSQAQQSAEQAPLAPDLPDTSAKAWMLVSFMGSSGSPLQVSLARR